MAQEILLTAIFLMLWSIWITLRQILAKLKPETFFDPNAPTNQYGEGLSEGLQNSIARGLRGIDTNDR